MAAWTWKQAFLVSRTQLAIASPPGTSRIQEIDIANDNRRIVKFPSPSEDPRDPISLPVWHKAASLVVVSTYAFVANFTSSVIAPALQVWPMTFPQDPRSVAQLTHLIAVHVLFLGLGNVLWVPLSNWLGRRPILLVATLIMTLCSVWCGLASTYDSLLAARIFQSIGGAAADTVAPALIGDIYFIHERGRAMALYTILLCTGPIVGGTVGGYLAFRHGWTSIFWVSVALSALCFAGVAVFVPETLYDRPSAVFQELEATTHISSSSETKSPPTQPTQTEMEHVQPTYYKPYSFGASLGFRGRHDSLSRHLASPWKTLALPGTWLAMLHYGGLVGGVVTISTVGPQIVAMPPYLWKENVGLINMGGLIGAVLGYLYTHLLSDRLMNWRAKKLRRGTAEAEDRLPTLFFPLAVATCGFFVFGFCAQYPDPKRWIGLQFGYGMLAFGLMQVPSVEFNYLIDSYGSLAADCFTIVTIFRAIVAFAWSFFAAEWVQTRGGAEPFGIFGMLMGIFALLTIPLWRYGKRMRMATAAQVERWSQS